MFLGLGLHFSDHLVFILGHSAAFQPLFLIFYRQPVRFTGFGGQTGTGTEPNRKEFLVLVIGLISFSSRFGFLG